MARYIEADEAKSVIKANDWSNPVVPQVVGMIIDRIPTADVVPRAEVEELQAEFDDFTIASLAECKACGEKTSKVIADLQEKLSKAKAEVAREIFKEIEKTADACIESEWLRGSWFNMSKFKESLAELKKKYTEKQK